MKWVIVHPVSSSESFTSFVLSVLDPPFSPTHSKITAAASESGFLLCNSLSSAADCFTYSLHPLSTAPCTFPFSSFCVFVHWHVCVRAHVCICMCMCACKADALVHIHNLQRKWVWQGLKENTCVPRDTLDPSSLPPPQLLLLFVLPCVSLLSASLTPSPTRCHKEAYQSVPICCCFALHFLWGPLLIPNRNWISSPLTIHRKKNPTIPRNCYFLSGGQKNASSVTEVCLCHLLYVVSPEII